MHSIYLVLTSVTMKSYKLTINSNPQMDVWSTYTSLNNILKLFCLSFVDRRGSKIKNCKNYLRITLLVTFNFFINALCTYYRFPHSKDIALDIFDLFYLEYFYNYIRFNIDIIFVFKNTKKYIEYFETYEVIDSGLGRTFYPEIKKRIQRIYIIIVFWFFASIIDITTWALVYGWVKQIKYIIDYLHNLVKLLSGFDFIANCFQVKFRLQAIGDLLKEWNSCVNNLTGPHTQLKYKQRPTNASFRHLKLLDLRMKFKQINNSYLLLTEQCSSINILFGYRVNFFKVI